MFVGCATLKLTQYDHGNMKRAFESVQVCGETVAINLCYINTGRDRSCPLEFRRYMIPRPCCSQSPVTCNKTLKDQCPVVSISGIILSILMSLLCRIYVVSMSLLGKINDGLSLANYQQCEKKREENRLGIMHKFNNRLASVGTQLPIVPPPLQIVISVSTAGSGALGRYCVSCLG